MFILILYLLSTALYLVLCGTLSENTLDTVNKQSVFLPVIVLENVKNVYKVLTCLHQN